uniref:MBL fold metallo-hydrolase n=1 Tax=Citrobacter freundii TaxID=546 RepID=UPI0020178EC5|nr:MBL fold metallo-hydrolase [Citrobacter freundii]
MVSRIFFPIGQGAFYAEKHETFNVVYDCGNWKQTNLSKKVVSQSFSKSEGVKILFISHFDWDHISLIKNLKNSVSSIDYVILPLLHKNHKILLRNLYRSLDYDSQTLINSPENFFGEGTKIIYITPAENNEINDITINIDDESESAPSRNIQSGTIVKVSSNNYDWCFIPFNIKNNERARVVEEKLESAGFDVEKLKTESSYTINNIMSKADKNKLKIYITHFKEK